MAVSLKSLTENIKCDPIENLPKFGQLYWAPKVQIGKYIFTFGGASDNEEVVDEVYRYDMEENLWTRLAPMLEARLFHSVTRISDEEFMIIGRLIFFVC